MTEQKETDPSAPTTTTIATATAGETRANLFPQYLMKLLNDQVAPDALWWLPDGCAFALDPNKITDQVLDKHFQKTKYSSFIRRLHNEGYRRQTRRYKKVDGLTLPEGTVVLSHDLFQRDKPQLLESFYKKSLEAANTAKSSSSAAMNSTTKLQDVKAAKLPRPSHTTTKVATVPPPVTAAPASFPTLDPLVRAGRQVSDQAAAAAAVALQRLEPLAPGGRQTSDQAAAAMLNFSALSRLSSAAAAGGTFPAPTASLAASLGGGAGGAMTALGSHTNGLLGASASATSAIGGAGVDAHHAHLTSLSKSIAELREARLRRELLGNPAAAYPTQILPSHHYQHLHNAAAAANAANLFSSEDAIRHLLLQHGYMQGLSRASSAESGASGNPVGAAPTAAAAGLLATTNGNANDTAAAAAAGGLAPSMSRLQELELETHRRRLQLEAEQQGQRHLTALDALRRAAYFDHHLNR